VDRDIFQRWKALHGLEFSLLQHSWKFLPEKDVLLQSSLSFFLFLHHHLSWTPQSIIAEKKDVFRFHFAVVSRLSGAACIRLVTNLRKQFRIGTKTDCLQMRSLQCYLTLTERSLLSWNDKGNQMIDPPTIFSPANNCRHFSYSCGHMLDFWHGLKTHSLMVTVT
jgi:hypothetical protein